MRIAKNSLKHHGKDETSYASSIPRSKLKSSATKWLESASNDIISLVGGHVSSCSTLGSSGRCPWKSRF